MASRVCARCGSGLPGTMRAQARYCSNACRQASYRRRPPVDRDPIPAELRTRPRWVRHSAGKVPLDARGRIASSTDPRTWSPYSEVQHQPRRGFVLNGDGVVCLDLDHCVVDGRVVGRAAQILADLPPTYVELSPSGTGLHVWGVGRVEQGRKLPGGVEIYGTGRFITVTGVPWRSSVRSLADLSGVLERLV